MTDLDHFVIPRAHWKPFLALLDQIPAILDDLAVTVTRQDRIGTGSLGSSGDPTIPLPINLAASDAADDLKGELRTWVKHTVRHRDLPGPTVLTTAAYAHWLSRHLVDLAQTPEADMAHDRIERCIRNCRRACDRPAERIRTFDEEQRDQLRALELSARDCAAMSARFGIEQTISQRRIKYLADEGRLTPIRLDGKRETRIFNLGHVLDAHKAHTAETAETA